MITHYLKVALRNLLKYKAHSFISAICLAIGITCFCLTNYFIDIVPHKQICRITSVASAWPAVRRIPQPTSIGNWMTSVIWMNNP